MTVAPEHLAEVIAALPAHVRLTRAEPGCLQFDVQQDPNDPTRFLVSELFIDRTAFEAHQQRAGTSSWAEITAGMARHYTVSEES